MKSDSAGARWRQKPKLSGALNSSRLARALVVLAHRAIGLLEVGEHTLGALEVAAAGAVDSAERVGVDQPHPEFGFQRRHFAADDRSCPTPGVGLLRKRTVSATRTKAWRAARRSISLPIMQQCCYSWIYCSPSERKLFVEAFEAALCLPSQKRPKCPTPSNLLVKPPVPFVAAIERALNPIAEPALRVVAGAFLLPHGTQKLFGWFGGYGVEATGQFFAEQAWPAQFVRASRRPY